MQNIIIVCFNSIKDIKHRFKIYTCKFKKFNQCKSCVSTAIYIDAILSYYLMVFLITGGNNYLVRRYKIIF